LLIGKPNVGKSNILEAIGLFSLPYFKYNKTKKVTQFVRLENLAELFFDGDIDKKITISADNESYCNLEYPEPREFVYVETELKRQKPTYELARKPLTNEIIENIIIAIDNKFNLWVEKSKSFYPSPKVKYYKFPHTFVSKKQSNFMVLIPPCGVNLLDVIQRSDLKNELSEMFSEYGLQLVFDKASHSIKIMKAMKENAKEIFLLPYSSLADTLQRIIFFKAAIASNENSIILFEEPEAHCFPPYIRQITQDILDSETNQFFIATHSPYVLNDFLEYERNDVAIFIANFKNGETVIRRLTDEEVNDVYQYGIDLFFNHELFTDDQEH